MGKNNLTYVLLIVTILLLAISTGFFFYKYQQKSNLVSEKDKTIAEKISFLSSISSFEEYSKGYSNDISIIRGVLDKTNVTQDYTSCMGKVNKYTELDTKFNQDEDKKVIFLQSISINEECNNAINKFSSLINTTKDSRDNYRVKYEKWCYGYHKADWSYTWVEEYSTPMDSAFNDLDASETKLGDAFSEAKVICLKQISK